MLICMPTFIHMRAHYTNIITHTRTRTHTHTNTHTYTHIHKRTRAHTPQLNSNHRTSHGPSPTPIMTIERGSELKGRHGDTGGVKFLQQQFERQMRVVVGNVMHSGCDGDRCTVDVMHSRMWWREMHSRCDGDRCTVDVIHSRVWWWEMHSGCDAQ